MTLQLYCFGESGNAYKVALALKMTGLEWEPRHLDFFAGAARTPDYRATVNEMGEAPVLMDRETGLHLTQSGVMLDWIAETTGKLGRRDARGAARDLALDPVGQSQAVGPDRHLPVPDALPRA